MLQRIRAHAVGRTARLYAHRSLRFHLLPGLPTACVVDVMHMFVLVVVARFSLQARMPGWMFALA